MRELLKQRKRELGLSPFDKMKGSTELFSNNCGSSLVDRLSHVYTTQTNPGSTLAKTKPG